ncbi:PAS domain-containing protein [Spirosoma pollinicola]|uniref:histidine kinase n=1 Tax=Spirosoma pollinicola TaxID=2057025 RepID=A0A2K8YW59_9BACT|nr:PAS domain-containing sensor histidine kinase [Spirosoma pollinicola]AUD01788.1 hypothetical protein CWM47_08115 [Spirosoma pollinicola]
MNYLEQSSPSTKQLPGQTNAVDQTDLLKENYDLRTFFNLDNELHCITDRNGNILRINRAWEILLGYSQADLLNLNYLVLVHSNDMIAALTGTPYLSPHQPAQIKRFRLRKKNGEYMSIEWHISFVDDHVYASGRELTGKRQYEQEELSTNGEPVDKVAIWDASIERKQAEEALRQSEQRFRAIFDLTYQFIGLMRPDGILLEVNETALQAAGQTLGDVIGKPFWENFWWQISEEERQKLKRAIQQAANGELVRYEVEIQDANHEVLALDMSIKPILNEQAKVVLLISEGRDITKKKRAENALRESEQRFREIAENVNDALWIHSAQPFQLLYINPAFERGVGYTAQQLRETPELLLEAVTGEDRTRFMADFVRYGNGEVLTGQYRLLGANRMNRWFTIRTFIMKDCQGRPLRYIGVASDITSQKEKELVLQQSLARERELNRLKSQFVAIASHEFRTPLATIQSSVDLISLYLDKPELVDKLSIYRHISVIENEIVAFSKLLTDVLTVGKMDEGKITFTPRLVDFVDLSQTIISTHFSQYRDIRAVQLSIEGAPYHAFIDDKLIKHVLINLLTNAFKFSTSGPELRILFTEKQLIFSVTDFGIGIPKEDMPFLFEPFFRAGNAETVQGTGLGLAISRQFVVLHGGHFTVCSEQHQGATFTVTIPITNT